MAKGPQTDKQWVHYHNREITKIQGEMSRIEDYAKVVQSLLPIVELAYKLSTKAGIDNGEGKKTWRMILADIMTIKKEIEDFYSDISDVAQGHQEEINKLTKEV